MKTLLLRLSNVLLPGTLFVFGLGLSLLLVFGQSAAIKTAVANSGLYNVLVDDLLAEQKHATIGSLSIPLSDPHIKQATESAFTPAVLQSAAEEVIDGFYNWIQGKTEQPVATVNLNGAKEQAAENIATYVTSRVEALPTCGTSELYQLYNSGALANGNYYSLTCRPSSLSAQTVHSTVQQSILSNSEFVNKITVNASTLADENGEPLYKKLSFVPVVYKAIVWSTYATGVIALLTLAGVVLLRPRSKRRLGLKRAAIVLLWVGIPSALLAIATAWGSNYLEQLATSASGSDTALQVKALAIARELIGDIRNWWLWIAGTEIVIGAGLLVWLRLSKKPVQLAPSEHPRENPAIPESSAEHKKAPAERPPQKTIQL